MAPAHYHLMFNHLPIIGTIIGFLVLLCGYFLRNKIVQQTALWIFIFSTITLLLANTTGEKAEHALKQFPEVSRKMIHHHEDIAGLFTWSLTILGIASILNLYIHKKHEKFLKLFVFLIPALAITTIYFANNTATSGGEIRHVEIRNEKANPVDSEIE
jgi:uncharacterized membrane protein